MRELIAVTGSTDVRKVPALPSHAAQQGRAFSQKVSRDNSVSARCSEFGLFAAHIRFVWAALRGAARLAAAAGLATSLSTPNCAVREKNVRWSQNTIDVHF